MTIRTQLEAGGRSATHNSKTLQDVAASAPRSTTASTSRMIRAICLAVAMAFLAEASVMMAYDGASSCSVWQKVKSTVFGVECSAL